MKKWAFIIIGIVLFSSISYAETVNTTRAITVAKNWYQHFNPKKVPVSRTRVRVSTIKDVQTEQYNNLDTFYIINMTTGGFVLVSAEDAIAPVLAYSFDTEIDQSTINPAAREWLDYYSSQIAEAIACGITSAQALDEWQSVEDDAFSTETSALSVPSMPPMLSTQWNQSPRYNNLTPDDTPTGCLATAMAQIMKYYNYPEYGVGQHEYTHDTYGVLSADFNTQYQWTKMPNTLSASSTADEISAVATLMYHCGISVDMNYAPGGSSASTPQVPLSLYKYFGYASTAIYKNKADYTDQEWTDILIAELNAFRPVQYRGEDSSGNNGHGFVCDGYQGTDYFHFNWGWGGANDGYYRVSLLDPSSSDFSYGQGAVFGIQPEKVYERITLLSDSFEDSFPSNGWSQTIVTAGTPSPAWSQISNGVNPTCTPANGIKMLQFNSNSAPDGAEARLILPVIDLSDVDYPRLTFNMYHEDSNASKTTEGVTVQLSENGTDWTDIRFYPRYIMTTGWQTYRVDLTYYTGKTVIIGFLGHSALGSNIYVDQIELNYAGPTSGMTSETLISYANASISFTDDSFNASSYSWNFGDTETASTQNVTHAYSNPGLYTIIHSVDNGASSSSQIIQILPVIVPSYLPEDGGNFESNFLHFSTQLLDGNINLWELGQPGNTISNTASGINVWKTDLDSNLIENNQTCALYTPEFDLSSTGSYFVKFKYRMENVYGNCPGAAWMEYSTDQGKTWQRLGSNTGNPDGTENWYNTDDHGVAPDGICWWHTRTEYTQAIYNLTALYGEKHVAFRLIYQVAAGWSDDGYDIDGFAVDDFSVEYEAPTADFSTDHLFSYVGKTISFTDQSTFPDNWSWDFGDSTTSSNQHTTHAYTSPGQYTVTLSINDNASHVTKSFIILPVITPSYLPDDGGNFENDTLHFITDIIDGTMNLWERGIPSNTIANTVSGTSVWKTDLDSNIQKDTYTCALYTPAFDLATTGSYYLKFNYRMQVYYGNCPGAAWLEYSTDGGDTWQRLGSDTGNPEGTENWYNINDHGVAPDGICWWHTKTEYTQAVYNLASFLGETSISFRFVYKVAGNWSVEGYDIDGFAIDDFSLEYIPPSANFQTETSIYYVGKTISFTDQSTFPDNWSWDFGDSTTSSNQNVTHTYSEPGEYSITLSINGNTSTTTQQITVLPTIKPSYSPDDGGNFESNALHFLAAVTDGDINLWERGTPSNIIADTSSGTTVWKTDLDSDIQQANYTCVLYTPNFNFSREGDYFIKFNYRMHITAGNCPGAGWLEYSTDFGETWQRLGSYTGNPDSTQNWYNTSTHGVAPDGICWWTIESTYTQAIYNLSEFSGQSNISFRFVFMVQGNWSGGYDSDGWSIDDFEIEHLTNAPTIHTSISDQTIDEDSAFTLITLDNYVSDSNHSLTEITWTTSGQSNLSVNINTNRIASITINSTGWSGSEPILFTATDPEGLTDTDSVLFTVIAVNDPPIVTDIPNQSIAEGASFTAIQLDNYVSDEDHTDSEIVWTATGQSELTVTIINRTASISTPSSAWSGSEIILFTATDPEGLTASESVTFTVTSENDPPALTEWRKIDAPSVNFTGVWGLSSDEIVAVTDDGKVYIYNGSEWILDYESSGTVFNDIWIDDHNYFVAASDGIYAKRSNVWEVDFSGTNYNGISAEDYMVYAAGNGQINKTYKDRAYSGSEVYFDDSEMINAVFGVPKYDIHGSTDMVDLYAVGNNGLILSFRGYQWTHMANTSTNNLLDIWGIADLLIAVGEGGKILINQADSWENMESNTANTLNSVWGLSEIDVTAVSTNGTIHHYDGVSWTEIPVENTESLNAIWGNNDIQYIVGDNGTVYQRATHHPDSQYIIDASSCVFGIISPSGAIVVNHGADQMFYISPTTEAGYTMTVYIDSFQIELTSNNAYTFTTVTQNHTIAIDIVPGVLAPYVLSMVEPVAPYNMTSIWGDESGAILATSEIGTICVLQDNFDPIFSYKTWWYYDSIAGMPINDIFGYNNTFFVGIEDTSPVSPIYKTDYANQVPFQQETGWFMTEKISGIWGSSEFDVFAIGKNGFYKRNDMIWEEIWSGDPTLVLTAIFGISDGEIYFAGNQGSIFHYDGFAVTQMTNNSAAYLFDIWGNTNVLYAVGELGTVLKLEGDTWTEIESGSTHTFYSIWGHSENDIYVVSKESEIFHYDGNVWSDIESSTRRPLKAIWGDGQDIYIVGGYGTSIFTVTSANDPPVVSGISDQIISEGSSFTAIQLD
ncbi:MAG: C10 family peptidase, partial [Candidatus Magnetomorum sp.]|nr:C10 family peptidase [Candidatus Magnetomorum sp.]